MQFNKDKKLLTGKYENETYVAMRGSKHDHYSQIPEIMDNYEDQTKLWIQRLGIYTLLYGVMVIISILNSFFKGNKGILRYISYMQMVAPVLHMALIIYIWAAKYFFPA